MKYVLITGGSGGLGRESAVYFADRGYYVFSCDIKKHKEERDNIEQLTVDVTDSGSVRAAREHIESKTSALAAVVSFAGIYLMDSFVEIAETDYKRLLDVNLLGPYRVNKEFLPLVRGGGRIIIITSELSGHKPLPFNGLYSLSKTALQHYADSLRIELALLSVPVVTVRPGAFATDMVGASHDAMRRMTERTRLYRTNTEKFKRIMETQTGTAKPPVLLARTVFRAATARRPRLQYTVNAGFLLWFYNLLPKRLQTWAIKKLIKT